MQATVSIALVAAFAAPSQAKTITVGAGGSYSTLAAAAKAAVAGDVIAIRPGTYAQCATIYRSGITIRASGGPVIFKGTACSGKAALVITGNDVKVDGLTFANISVRDGNGAGIRFEGQNLTVSNSKFMSSQAGILTSTSSRGTLTVTGSTFDRVGACVKSSACAHGIYANGLDALIVSGSTFNGIRAGHAVKSRAKSTTVTGSTFNDGSTGTASYHIDASNGGNVLIQNNSFTKGPKTGNRGAFIALGHEGTRLPTDSLVVTGNKVRSSVTSGTPYFVSNRTSVPVTLGGNSFSGRVSEVAGPFSRQAAAGKQAVMAMRSVAAFGAPGPLDAIGAGQALSTLSLLATDEAAAGQKLAAARFSPAASARALVPEPGTIWLAGFALVCLGLLASQRRRRAVRLTRDDRD